MSPDGLFIDFYGTIAAGDRDVVEQTCRRVVDHFSLPMDAAGLARRWGDRFFDAITRHNDGSFRTLFECECSSLLETLRGDVGEFDPAPFCEDLRTYWRRPPLHDDAREALTAVAALPVPVCLVSNVDRDDVDAAIEHLGLRFDYVVTSEDARSYKPHGDIFKRALRDTGWRRERTLHVGDSLHSDVFGATEAGILGVWLNRPDRIHDIGRAEPAHTIHSLAELAALCTAPLGSI